MRLSFLTTGRHDHWQHYTPQSEAEVKHLASRTPLSLILSGKSRSNEGYEIFELPATHKRKKPSKSTTEYNSSKTSKRYGIRFVVVKCLLKKVIKLSTQKSPSDKSHFLEAYIYTYI